MSTEKKKNSTQLNLIDINQLVKGFLNGNDEAYAAIYRLYVKDMIAYGLSLCLDINTVEDAIHDVFTDLYIHRGNLEKVKNLKYYLISAFRHRLFVLLKNKSQTANISSEYANILQERDYQDLWIEQEEEAEKKKIIEQLFSSINLHQREALYFRFVEGASYEDIAHTMNINVQSVRNLIHRAIQKLKTEFIPLLLSIAFFLFIQTLTF